MPAARPSTFNTPQSSTPQSASLEAALVKPVRVAITNLRTFETKEVLANPRELEVVVDVEWTEQKIPGLSHTVLQYENTGNVGFPMELYLSEYQYSKEIVEDWRNFLWAFAYADYDASDILEGAPARMMIVWPNVLSLTCVLRRISMKHVSFALDGRATRSIATIQTMEIRDVRIGASDVRVQGIRRAQATSAGSAPTSGGVGPGPNVG